MKKIIVQMREKCYFLPYGAMFPSGTLNIMQKTFSFSMSKVKTYSENAISVEIKKQV